MKINFVVLCCTLNPKRPHVRTTVSTSVRSARHCTTGCRRKNRLSLSLDVQCFYLSILKLHHDPWILIQLFLAFRLLRPLFIVIILLSLALKSILYKVLVMKLYLRYRQSDSHILMKD